MSHEKQPDPVAYTDRVEVRLVPQAAPNEQILRDLIEVIRRAQQQRTLRVVRRDEFQDASPEEAPEQYKALARAVVRMEQIAAETQEEGERLQKLVETQGPSATDLVVRAAESAIGEAVQYCRTHGLQITVEPLE